MEELYAGNRVVKVFNRQAACWGGGRPSTRPSSAPSAGPSSPTTPSTPAIRVLGQLGFIATAVWAADGPGRGYHPGHCAGLFAVCQPDRRAGDRASYVITSLQAAIAGAERVFALLDEEEERPDAAGDASVITQGHVEFRHVRFGYTPERTLIHDLNLECTPTRWWPSWAPPAAARPPWSTC